MWPHERREAHFTSHRLLLDKSIMKLTYVLHISNFCHGTIHGHFENEHYQHLVPLRFYFQSGERLECQEKKYIYTTMSEKEG
jgi:hypothetical protein